MTHAGPFLRIALVVTFALFVAAPIARAQEDARTMFQRGQVAYSQGAYEDAIEQWEAAYRLDPRPLLQWNLSQAYERLGRLDEAAHSLDTYLSTADPSDEHQADARARLSAIRDRIQSTGVLLRGGPDGASVTLDDADAGRLPRPDAIHVTPGSHRIVVHAAGYADFRTTVVVPAGQTTELTIEMASTAAPVVASSSEPPIGAIAVFSVAGVSLITASILGGVALSSASSAPSATSPEADTARTLGLTADVLFGVSAACAVVGVVLAVTTGGSSSSESASIRITPNGVAGTF